MRVSEADIALAHALADDARAAILPYWRKDAGLETKADHSPVTLADRAAEAAMRKRIEAESSADGILGEEYGERPGASGRQWVLDPIDGTRAFIAGRPTFGTLIALVADGWPVLGIIDQPILGERWIGVIGQETLLNGKPVQTRRCRDLGDALLATTSPALFADDELHAFEHLDAKVRSVILGGDCYNYASVASGWLDVVVESQLKLHDIAALVPVVEGAGGRMCDWSGDPLTADSKGDVIAVGDPARLDDIFEALACKGH